MSTSHFLPLGIDVSKKKIDCALMLGAKFKNKVFANTPEGFASLCTWIDQHAQGPVHTCMEATGVYWEALAVHLANAGHRISVINPALAKAHARSLGLRSKTDAIDARAPADYCRQRQPELWVAPTPSEQRLRALVLRLQGFGPVMEGKPFHLVYPESRRDDPTVLAVREWVMAVPGELCK